MIPTYFYSQQQNQYQERLDGSAQTYNTLSYARLGVFIMGIVLTYWAFKFSVGLGIAVGMVSLGIFLYLVYIHDRLAQQRAYLKNLINICQKEQDALRGKTQLFDSGESYINPHHNYSFDLDIFGSGALFPALARTTTHLGRDQLAKELIAPSHKAEDIRALQQVVKELSASPEWGLEFEALGMQHEDDPKEVSDLINWIETPEYFSQHLGYRWLMYVLPSVLLVSLVIWVINLTTGFLPGFTGHIPLGLFLLNLGVVGSNSKRVNQQHSQVSKKSRILNKYSDLLQYIESRTFEAESLKIWQQQLSSEGRTSSEAIARLGQIAYNFDQRLNMVAGVILNGLILWDLIWVKQLELWKIRYRDQLLPWFEVLGKVDARVSLGRWAFNHPEYCWPILAKNRCLKAEGLGHPLLKKDTRIDNDISLGTDHDFLIITGANMAGKSTFLRTVGINLIMAQMGMPVCATKFVFYPMKVMTSMRTSDSLQDHESYFYAELKRLKRIIDRLKEDPGVFVIVDEMLRGTNSKDKHTGSLRFIVQLIQHQGMGLIATHDLSLGTLAEEYPQKVRNRCFEVDIQDGQLYFDYRLREGLSQKLNATFLMEQMGIM